MKPKRLLIIDDDCSTLFALRQVFRKAGICVDTAETLDQAKSLIDSNSYEVIITDLHFSDVEEDAGIIIASYAKLKQPGVKVILWTATDKATIIEKARAAKIDVCLIKPISPFIMQNLVEGIQATR
jgi:DNA-binding NtrC family response regulator